MDNKDKIYEKIWELVKKEDVALRYTRESVENMVARKGDYGWRRGKWTDYPGAFISAKDAENLRMYAQKTMAATQYADKIRVAYETDWDTAREFVYTMFARERDLEKVDNGLENWELREAAYEFSLRKMGWTRKTYYTV